MAFDTATRNKLARMVASARTVLTTEFTGQLQEIYGIQPDGTIIDLDKLTHLDDEQQAIAAMLRDRVKHLASTMTGEKKPQVAAIDRMIREQAFTLLNRFAALRMCEERKLIQESIGNGIQSKGFKVYLQIAGSGLGDTYARYKTYLLCLFDEIAVDLGVLFDRYSPMGLLFPREDCLMALLEVLDGPEIQPLWAEDETIGWIYQYFNSQEERKKMRKASAAPRNSRELAVRNQFFTPRYVVEFLTDNTLGRIWYEMTQGETALKEECRYLVRRPNEIFLSEGETAPEEKQNNENLSQEELLQQPVYIPFRRPKDPRQIRMLDPACGSMHFGLYAFDLYERIYQEAWEIEEQYGSVHFEREEGLQPLHDFYENKEKFLLDIPRLIIEYNIHGIDIDPRAVQIAGLSLWLRAQRTWQQQGVRQDARPAITRSNIVCAEPMPGDKAMLAGFCENLKPKVLGQLLEIVFDKMQLAGEAGSLLKIEEEIADAVEEARQEFNRELRIRKKTAGYLPGMAPEVQQTSIFDFTDLPDKTEFWERAEEMIILALKDYADKAEKGDSNRRRLFAKDAARGFAFIDICRKRYDVVLMNPPFGSGSKRSEKYLNLKYTGSGSSEVCASFYSRALEYLHDNSLFGAISSRTFYYLNSLKDWRCDIAFSESTLLYWIDLGQGILDDAMNETAAYVISKGRQKKYLAKFGMYHREEDKEKVISFFVGDGANNYHRFISDFEILSDKPLCYWVSNSFFRSLSQLCVFGRDIAEVQMGLAPRDEFRFSRLWWEIVPNYQKDNNDWKPYAKGGELSPYYSDVELMLKAKDNLSEIKASLTQKYPYLKGNLDWVLHPENNYFESGLTFGQRTTFLRVSVLPSDSYFSVAGKGIFGKSISNKALLQLINTPSCQYLMSLRKEHLEINPQYQEGDVARMPWPEVDDKIICDYEKKAAENVLLVRGISSRDEIDHCFLSYLDADLVSEARQLAEKTITLNEQEADVSFGNLLGLDEQDRRFIQKEILPRWHSRSIANWFVSGKVDRIQYIIGCILGRWDIRIAIDPSLAPKLPDPFDPLPLCPPGMLVGPDGLPTKSGSIVSEEWLRASPDANTLPPEGSVKKATISDSEYPLRISWDGILVDESGNDGTQSHRENIVRRVREVIDILWKDKAPEIEQEACEILGVKDLHEYFYKPTKFFQDHLKRYSKSRRKAPIYWPLSTESGSYTLWLYYHRLTDQTLFTCVTEFLDPKIKDVSADIAALKEDIQQESSTDKRRELEKLQDLERELQDFREELLSIASLPYKPNLNDGVMITAAPLWKLFRHRQWSKDLKKCWQKLEKGDYDWAHLAYSIWPELVIPKCHKDRSLAIAHGLEEELWEEVENGKDRQGNPKYKWVPKKLSKEDIQQMIREKTGR